MPTRMWRCQQRKSIQEKFTATADKSNTSHYYYYLLWVINGTLKTVDS